MPPLRNSQTNTLLEEFRLIKKGMFCYNYMNPCRPRPGSNSFLNAADCYSAFPLYRLGNYITCNHAWTCFRIARHAGLIKQWKAQDKTMTVIHDSSPNRASF